MQNQRDLAPCLSSHNTQYKNWNVTLGLIPKPILFPLSLSPIPVQLLRLLFWHLDLWKGIWLLKGGDMEKLTQL